MDEELKNETMTLYAIPGAPGYFADVKKGKVYSVKRGELKEMSKSGKYQYVGISIGNKRMSIGLPRILYAVEKNIPIDKIPIGFCIRRDKDGKIEVVTRKELSKENAMKALSTGREDASVEWVTTLKETEKITKFYSGNQKPLLKTLTDYCVSLKKYLKRRYGIYGAKADNLCEEAQMVYLDRVCKKNPKVPIYPFLVRTVNLIRKKRKDYVRYYDWTKPIEIDL